MGTTPIERFARGVRALPGVDERGSRFRTENRAWFVGRAEFAHEHGGAIVDLRVPRHVQRRYRDDASAILRAGASEWMEYRVATNEDLAEALELARVAWERAVERERRRSARGGPA